MSIAQAASAPVPLVRARQPNEFDRCRIVRALEGRKRYRYVEPSIEAITDGYLVRSPCCSRTVDPAGGEIDVALLLWDEARGEWDLFRRDHTAQSWIEDGRFARLGELLERLKIDPSRVFWQ